jgi:hypothetical protein
VRAAVGCRALRRRSGGGGGSGQPRHESRGESRGYTLADVVGVTELGQGVEEVVGMSKQTPKLRPRVRSWLRTEVPFPVRRLGTSGRRTGMPVDATDPQCCTPVRCACGSDLRCRRSGAGRTPTRPWSGPHPLDAPRLPHSHGDHTTAGSLTQRPAVRYHARFAGRHQPWRRVSACRRRCPSRSRFARQ